MKFLPKDIIEYILLFIKNNLQLRLINKQFENLNYKIIVKSNNIKYIINNNLHITKLILNKKCVSVDPNKLISLKSLSCSENEFFEGINLRNFFLEILICGQNQIFIDDDIKHII